LCERLGLCGSISMFTRVGDLLWIIYVVKDHFDFAIQSFSSHTNC